MRNVGGVMLRTHDDRRTSEQIEIRATIEQHGTESSMARTAVQIPVALDRKPLDNGV